MISGRHDQLDGIRKSSAVRFSGLVSLGLAGPFKEEGLVPTKAFISPNARRLSKFAGRSYRSRLFSNPETLRDGQGVSP